MIRFNCAGCGKLVQVSDQHAGKKGRCPYCRTLMKIPPCEDAIGHPITGCDDELDDEEGGVIDEGDLTPELRAKINALAAAGGWEAGAAANNEEGGVIDEGDLTPELRAKINALAAAGGWEAGGAANNEEGGVIDEGDLTPELRAKINVLAAAGGWEAGGAANNDELEDDEVNDDELDDDELEDDELDDDVLVLTGADSCSLQVYAPSQETGLVCTARAKRMADELKGDLDRLSRLGVDLDKAGAAAKPIGVGGGIFAGFQGHPWLGIVIAGAGLLANFVTDAWKKAEIAEVRQKWWRQLTSMNGEELLDFERAIQLKYPLLMSATIALLSDGSS